MKVIGLISGTSVDGIDAVLVEVTGSTYDLSVELIAAATYPYPEELRSQILAVCHDERLSMAELADLDDAIASVFAQAALTVQAEQPAAELIGSHGQTVYHRPPQKAEGRGQRAEGRGRRAEGGGQRAEGRGQKAEGGRIKAAEKTADSSLTPPQSGSKLHLSSPLSHPHPSAFCHHPSALGYSLQLGRGNLIAHLTGIPTVSNFRAADIAVGGQGAPLVPPVDVCLLSHPIYHRCVQNIGGIGNVAYLPAIGIGEGKQRAEGRRQRAEGRAIQNLKSKIQNFPAFPILGWDTGPGNSLLDLAVQRLSGGRQTFDQDGAWAAQGTPCQPLVQQWLQQDFFQQPPPKSTGRELFGAAYLDRCLQEAAVYQLSPADILATLTELTAASIAQSHHLFLPQLPDQVLLCGGGSHNRYLKQRIQANLESVWVGTTDEVGLSADYKEAIAFAVLAYWRMQNIPGNLPEVTGAQQAVLLGEIHLVASAQAD